MLGLEEEESTTESSPATTSTSDTGGSGGDTGGSTGLVQEVARQSDKSHILFASQYERLNAEDSGAWSCKRQKRMVWFMWLLAGTTVEAYKTSLVIGTGVGMRQAHQMLLYDSLM